MWKEGLGLLSFWSDPHTVLGSLRPLLVGSISCLARSMKIRNVILTTVLIIGGAYIATELIPAMNDNRKYREGMKELDRARSRMNRIKNQVMPDSKVEALRASYELQGRLEYIQDHYGIDSETIDAQVGTELYRMIENLKN